MWCFGLTCTRDDIADAQAGVSVCVCARTLFLWSRNPLQVVYADTRGAAGVSKRFAFAHGTLHNHMLVRAVAVTLRVPSNQPHPCLSNSVHL